jgi:aminoglycoside/choline kinase family phosphotransferase
LLNSSRKNRRFDFLETAGLGTASIIPLHADASFQRYFRVEQSDGSSMMLMDAPPDKEEILPYIRISEHLVSLGLSAPRILGRDEENGFLLIEDFGDDTFTRLLGRGVPNRGLYEWAIDVLIDLHLHPRGADIDVPPYDLRALLEEAVLLPDWFWPEKKGKACPSHVRNNYLNAWQTVFDGLPEVPRGLVLRDYHVDNLMLLRDRTGVAACGLLDFQDALIGPWAYDVVSLLEDARRDVPQELVQAMKDRYFDGIGLVDRDSFEQWYAVLGAQRHAKVAGIFVRLFRRDGKAQYLEHIPRVVRLLSRHMNAVQLSPVQAWLENYLPDYLDPLTVDQNGRGRKNA